MLKKSQVQQMFIYVIAIILFSLLLAYGYGAIKSISSKTDQVTLIQMKNDITSGVDSVKSDYKTTIKKELDVPFKYKEICFVDLTRSGSSGSANICSGSSAEYKPLVCNSWESNADYNMFIISPEDTKTYNIGEIRVDDPFFFCTNVTNGKTTLRLEGKGDYVLLSVW